MSDFLKDLAGSALRKVADAVSRGEAPDASETAGTVADEALRKTGVGSIDTKKVRDWFTKDTADDLLTKESEMQHQYRLRELTGKDFDKILARAEDNNVTLSIQPAAAPHSYQLQVTGGQPVTLRLSDEAEVKAVQAEQVQWPQGRPHLVPAQEEQQSLNLMQLRNLPPELLAAATTGLQDVKQSVEQATGKEHIPASEAQQPHLNAGAKPVTSTDVGIA